MRKMQPFDSSINLKNDQNSNSEETTGLLTSYNSRQATDIPTSDVSRPTTGRPGWDRYFMDIAKVVSSRSTCLRRQVGAIIVKERRILASGYNGAPAGLRHCLEIGCLREQKGIPSGERHELCRGLHAEQNALIQAAVYGTAIQGAVYYVTDQPCVLCAKMIINTGIKKVVFQGDYPDPLALKMFEEAGVELVRLNFGESAR